MYLAALFAAALSAVAAPGAAGGTATAAQGDSRPRSDTRLASASDHPKLLGLQLSAGFPDGLTVAAVLHPLRWLRADAGLAYNALSLGVAGGVTVIPWGGRIAPTFGVTGGHFFAADVSSRFGGSLPPALGPALRHFGYDFVAAHAGLDFGDPGGTVFFVRGGVAWARSGLDATTYRDGTTTVVAKRNDISATGPSLQAGVLFHLW